MAGSYARFRLVREAQQLAGALRRAGYVAYIEREGTSVELHTRGSYKPHTVCSTSAAEDVLLRVAKALSLRPIELSPGRDGKQET